MAVPITAVQGEIRWTAQLAHVREVSLLGSADYDYWRKHLSPSGLIPIERAGRAQMLIVGADAKFRGVRFSEISFSVLARPDDSPADGAYLVGAWNSSRFFAWCERAFFRTPYVWGDVRVCSAPPVSIELGEPGRPLFRADLRPADSSQPGRTPDSRQPGGWAGAIYLPPTKPRDTRRKFYFARLAGLTDTYAFVPGIDTLTINTTPLARVLTSLIDSNFTPTRWEIRADATHARSKTYAR